MAKRLTMLKGLVCLLLVSQGPSAIGADRLEGVWFTCIPEMAGRHSPYRLYSITREGLDYVVNDEWGTANAFSGRATKVGDNLVLRGCSYYRGEPSDGCDIEDPPVVSKRFAAPMPMKSASVDISLKRSQPIRTTNSSWPRLARRCEELVNAIEKQQLEQAE